MARVRQNNLFVNSITSLLSAAGGEAPRRCHSAFDLQSVADGYGSDLCGGYQNATNIMQQTNEDHDIMRTLRPISETSRLLQHDGRSSVTFHHKDRRFSNFSDTTQALALGKDHCRSIDIVQITSIDSKRTDASCEVPRSIATGTTKPIAARRASTRISDTRYLVSRIFE
ncbi:hypothetical protein HN011_000973 [Eciton burchellii]|nr:hypothetical protein HN011_000973 [Eciton burchellii]